MKIVADKDIFQVEEYFSGCGNLELFPGREITRERVGDAEALLVRTITRIDQDLIKGSNLQFVGSAASGTDHVDQTRLAEAGITFSSAAGCNANAVVDYVFSVLAWLNRTTQRDWRKCAVGIIGCGHVGSALAARLLALDVKVAIYDPYLDQNHPLAANFCSFADVLQQDVITLHASLQKEGPYPSRHLLDRSALEKLKPECILMNTARGGIIDNQALDEVLTHRNDLYVVLDAWEGEPRINMSLYNKVTAGTPHIAGYSENGKKNATAAVYADFCRHFTIDQPTYKKTVHGKNLLSVSPDSTADDMVLLNALLLQAYPVHKDFLADRVQAEKFDCLRNNYVFRKEVRDFSVAATSIPETIHADARALGFSLV